MKHLITILLLPLTLLFAKPINIEQASNVALNFATLNHKTLTLDTHTSRMKRSAHSVHKKDKETPYYFINLKPKGWVLVSGNDVIDPILGFSFDANIDTNTPLPPALVSMLDGFESDIDYLESHAIKARSKISNMWDELSENPEAFRANIEDFRIRHKSSRSSRKKEVKPLLKTQWHQFAPYNTYTPIIAGKHTLVGCVATAMAQIMAYHQWPKKGIDKHTNKNYPSQSINFGITTYNWLNMTNNNIAKLSYHIGVATDMKYTIKGSTSDLEKASYAFKKHFSYTSKIEKRLYRDDYSTEDLNAWQARLEENLDKNLPVLYAGYKTKEAPTTGSDKGHAFVCDGYKRVNFGLGTKYHFNFGWKNGSGNGYYYISKYSAGEHYYYYRNIALFNIKPIKKSITLPMTYNKILPAILLLLE